MPRFGSRMRSRRVKKTRYSSNAKSNAYRLDKKFNKKIKEINSDIELKHADFQDSNVAETVPQVEYISPLTAGDSNINVVGNQAKLTSVQLKGNITFNDLYIQGGVVVRLIAFVDKAPNGAMPSIVGGSGNTLLNNTTVTDVIHAPYNHDLVGKGKKFKILYDKHFTLTPPFATTTTPATGVVAAVFPVQKYFSFNVKMNRMWSSTLTLSPDGTFASCFANGIYFAVMSDASANGPTVSYGTRVYYKDA